MDELVYQSERLAMEINEDLEMPRIKRNLSQILEAGNQLWNRTVGASANREASEVKASVLLGARGYDWQKVSRNLDSLVTRGVKHYSALANQSTQPVIRETDIQGFLKHEREKAVIQVEEEIKAFSREQVDKQYWHTVMRDWDKEKLELLNFIGGPTNEGPDIDLTTDMTISSPNKHDTTFFNTTTRSRTEPIISPSPFAERSIHNLVDTKAAKSNMDYTEIIYAKSLMGYVDQVVSSSSRPDLIKRFIEDVQKDITETNISDLWDTVSSIISCCDSIRTGSDPIKLRQDLQFQLKFVISSRSLLERKYREYAETTVHGCLNRVDDDPKSCYTLMKNFLSLKSPSWLSNITILNSTISDMGMNSDDGTVEGHPVWNFIWHCLRAGMTEAAIEVAQKSRDPSISETFVEILKIYSESEDKKLPLKMENELRTNYKRSISKSNDIYKKAVYNVLASCDLTFVEASDRIEDYLWLRLCQVRFDHATSSALNTGFDDLTPLQQSTPVKTASLQPALIAANKLTLPQLQSLMSEQLGETHFNAQENPLSFFKILFLTAQFEQAIEFLFRFQRFKSHAVHVAITLNEVGLLVKPDLYLSLPILSKAAEANSTSGAIKSLNYTNILIRYTKKFACQNTTEALYYYYLLRNCTTPTKENLFVTYVSELVRETRDFDNLLGYINDFGRIRGVIDRFNLDIDDIVSKVAEDCENSGQYQDAVKLYDSTSKYGRVLEILIKLLSEVLPGRKTDKSERDKLEDLALKIANRYCEPEVDAPRDIAGTFYLLLDLMTFFNYYHSNQYAEALDTIQKLKLLPFSQGEVEVKAREFNKYPEEIRRNISDILLATMNMLYTLYREQPNPEVRQKAKALISFSGMIQYRMPCDAITRLIELEVLIN